jgi:arylsulfatase A-like enzyme
MTGSPFTKDMHPQKGFFVLLIHIGLFLGSCTEEGFISGTSFDFFSHMDRAEVITRGLPTHPLRLLGLSQPWTEEDGVFCDAPPMTRIRFRGIPLGPDAFLSLGYGVHPAALDPRFADPKGKIRFQVALVAGNKRFDLLDQTVHPSRLEPGQILHTQIPLPSVTAKHGEFTFFSDASAGMEVYRPAWCGPVLTSRGFETPAEQAQVVYRHSLGLLLDTPCPDKNQERGVFFRADYDEKEKVFLPAPEGRLLVTTPPALACFSVSPPEDAFLSFGLAVVSSEPKGMTSAVCFRVLVDEREVFRETLSGKGKIKGRRISLPLPHKQEKVRITLCSELAEKIPRSEKAPAAVWIYPVVEQDVRRPRQRAGQDKNVILIVVDALRADHLSLYGYPRKTTPNLDGLANHGVVFLNTWAQSSWTIPSTATLLTGQYAYTHGLYDAYHWHLVPGISTVTQLYQREGITTAAFVANHLISEDSNFDVGFESFHEIPYASAAQLNRAFLHWLEDHKDERFFAYLHYMEPHLPYAAPGNGLNRFGDPPMSQGRLNPDRSEQLIQRIEKRLREISPLRIIDRDLNPEEREFLDELIGLYDSEIAYWDEQFAALVQALKERGLMENTLLIVTSDHGEEFLDHGLLTHGQSLYSELLQVPLIFLNTHRAPEKRKDMAGLVDLAPTLLALSHIPCDPGFAGRNLFSESTAPTFLFAQTAHGLNRFEGEMVVKRSVFSERWKGILTLDHDQMTLFDRITDPLERIDVGPARPEKVNEFRALIRDWVRSCRSRAPYHLSLLDASALRKLKEMGYL